MKNQLLAAFNSHAASAQTPAEHAQTPAEPLQSGVERFESTAGASQSTAEALQSTAETTKDTLTRLEANLSGVIRGKREGVRLLMIALLSGGHALLEDVPGTGKTTLAKTLAASIEGTFRRIQFTPDLLPADITGSSFYNPSQGEWEFRAGPVFCNILLADEINRTSPRTQSALLEVMSENQVTIEGRRCPLPQPFFVIATQNPSDFHGTYPLPEAQMDRFALTLSLGYPDASNELDILLERHDADPFDALQPVVGCEEILALQAQVKTVCVERAIAEYIVKIVDATRRDARLRLAISTRGALALYRAAQARALLEGRDYTVPDDVRELAVPALAHRLALDARAKYGGAQHATLIEEILDATPMPR